MVFEAFEVGREYSYQDINIEIGYRRNSSVQRGIPLVPIGDRSAVMIRMNLRSNLYGEEYDPSADTFYYIGDGLSEQGHQQRIHGNKRLTDNIGKDVHLFVRTREQRSGQWMYGGIWKVESYDPATRPDGSHPVENIRECSDTSYSEKISFRTSSGVLPQQWRVSTTPRHSSHYCSLDGISDSTFGSLVLIRQGTPSTAFPRSDT